MYFAVPFQSTGEQEIRIVSWDNSNNIQLDRYVNGSWIAVKSFTLNRLIAGDWVGKTSGNVSYSNVFRITCTPGKRVSVFEGNWFEIGFPGTSDMATMVSSENGTTAGKVFLTYIAPPGNEANVTNPFTGQKFGGSFSHLYLFSKTGATVTVKDAYSNGQDFSKTFTIAPERYADCTINLTEWKNMYNGTGSSSGPEKPYLIVTSNNDIAVLNSNFNDNWMCYTGSSLYHAFQQTSTVGDNSLIPAEETNVVSVITTVSEVTEPTIEVIVQDGLKVVESKLFDENQQETQGTITEFSDKTKVQFQGLDNLQPNSEYRVETTVKAIVGANNGELVGTTLNATVETIITGKVGGEIQQSTIAKSVSVQTTNTSNLLFSKLEDVLLDSKNTNSWTISWIDINKDGYDDLYLTDMGLTAPNLIYMNNTNGGFYAGQTLPEDGVSMSNTWADVDNDGDEDLLVLNNGRNPNRFYKNENGTLVVDNSKSFTQDISYYHGGAFADCDNDNKVDVFMCNYFPTKYNELHKNNSNGDFTKDISGTVSLEANSSLGPTWADYDQDGLMDLFVPNGQGNKNSLFHNNGNGIFSKSNSIVSQDGGKSVGSCWGDIDNDGDLDLFVANSNSVTNFLYKNLGGGIFEKITNSIVNQGGSSHGCSFADIDNDGDLDLYVSNDRIRKYLYFNDGQGNFSENREEMITYNFGLSFGHAWSDYDHDGDLDLAVATHSNQKNYVFKNNGNTNNWLEINLNATVSNGSAIGAKVFVTANQITQMREVNSQSGFGGQSSYTQHFGLSVAGVVDSIVVKWPSGIVQNFNAVNVNQILEITENVQRKVTGVVFLDINEDTNKQDAEPVISRAGIQIDPLETKSYSNENGVFSFYATQNNVNLKVLAENGIQEGIGVDFNLENYTVNDTIYIAAVPVCAEKDVRVTMGGTAIRKGYTNNQFKIVASNQSREVVSNSLVNFIVPSTISIQNVSQTIQQQQSFTDNGKSFNRYSWLINNLNPLENKVISFTTSNDATTQIGDELTFKGEILTSQTDCTPDDNVITQKYIVYGAIDPNDILVSPKGYGQEGYVLPNQVLTYTVRFENIGNFVAQNVEIVDMLPKELDVSTIKIISTSHDNLKTEIAGNNLKFVFDSINLPSSLEDKDKGQGYVTFSITPYKGLEAETKIVNKATIQFDLNEPLSTNTVLNTIQSKLSEQEMVTVVLYPNPVNDVAYISLKHQKGEEFTMKQIKSAEVLTLQGNVVLSKDFGFSEEIRMDMPIEFKGLYILKITDTEGKTYVRKMVVRSRE